MIERALDNRWFRLVFGAAVGVPFTAAALIGSVYGAIFLVGGVSQGQFHLVGLGLIAVFGVLGVVGAWRRLLKQHSAMSPRERLVVRLLLFSGVASGALLAGISALYAQWVNAAVFFAVVAAGGVIFVLGTPMRSNRAVENDAPRASLARAFHRER